MLYCRLYTNMYGKSTRFEYIAVLDNVIIPRNCVFMAIYPDLCHMSFRKFILKGVFSSIFSSCPNFMDASFTGNKAFVVA